MEKNKIEEAAKASFEEIKDKPINDLFKTGFYRGCEFALSQPSPHLEGGIEENKHPKTPLAKNVYEILKEHAVLAPCADGGEVCVIHEEAFEDIEKEIIENQQPKAESKADGAMRKNAIEFAKYAAEFHRNKRFDAWIENIQSTEIISYTSNDLYDKWLNEPKNG